MKSQLFSFNIFSVLFQYLKSSSENLKKKQNKMRHLRLYSRYFHCARNGVRYTSCTVTIVLVRMFRNLLKIKIIRVKWSSHHHFLEIFVDCYWTVFWETGLRQKSQVRSFLSMISLKGSSLESRPKKPNLQE